MEETLQILLERIAHLESRVTELEIDVERLEDHVDIARYR